MFKKKKNLIMVENDVYSGVMLAKMLGTFLCKQTHVNNMGNIEVSKNYRSQVHIFTGGLKPPQKWPLGCRYGG